MKRNIDILCIIGGTGYLGSSFRALYHKNFHKIIVLGRSSSFEGLRKNEVYLPIADLSSSELREYLRRECVTTIIDFAYSTIPKTSFENPVGDFSENLLLVNKHLEAIRDLEYCRYIYVSSGGTVYGDVKQDLIEENSQNFPVSPYGITKMACERYVKMYHHVYGLDAVIVRPSNIYGPGQRPFQGQGFISTAMASSKISSVMNVFGDGSNVRDFLYVDDFCRGLFDIIVYGGTGEIYNIGSALGKSLNDIIFDIRKIAAGIDCNLEIKFLPERRFDVAYNVLSNSKISALNNWKPHTSLSEGLQKTWEWLLTYIPNEV